MLLGLRPSSFEFLTHIESTLKRDLLFYEQIHVCSATDFNIFDELKPFESGEYRKLKETLERLYTEKVLFDFKLGPQVKYSMREMMNARNLPLESDLRDLQSIGELIKNIPEPLSSNVFAKTKSKKKMKRVMIKYKKSIETLENEATRISSLFLNRFSRRDEAIPLVYSNDKMILSGTYGKVLEIVLEKVPVIDANTPWEKILEFRKDKESIRKFRELRIWMSEIAKKDYSISEIKDRFEYLTEEYTRHLNVHKLRYDTGKLRALVVTSLDIIENLCKLNFSKIADKYFFVKDREIKLLEAELKLPGKEISYLLDIQRQFGSN